MRRTTLVIALLVSACQTSPNTPLRPEAVGDGPVTFLRQLGGQPQEPEQAAAAGLFRLRDHRRDVPGERARHGEDRPPLTPPAAHRFLSRTSSSGADHGEGSM